MVRTAVVVGDKINDQRAKDFANAIESVSQGVAWLQRFNRDRLEAAARKLGAHERFKDLSVSQLTLMDIRAMVEVLKRWELTGFTPFTAQEQATNFVATLTSVGDALGWLQAQEPAAVEAAQVQVGVRMLDADLGGLRKMAERVKLWELKGERPPAELGETKAEPTFSTVNDRLNEGEDGRAAETDRIVTRWEIVQGIRHREIDQLQKVAEAEEDVDEAKGRLKEQEAALEKIRQELGRAIDGDPIQQKLDFDQDEDDDKEKGGETSEAPATGVEAWRAESLDSLGLRPGVLKAFAENNPPLITVGDMADWQQKKGEFWAKDIDGIGPKAAEDIADAMERFWADHPQATRAAAAAPQNAAVAEAASPEGPEAAADGGGEEDEIGGGCAIGWGATPLQDVLREANGSFHGLGPLHEEGITTLGGLAAHVNKQGGINIVRVGKKTAEKIVAACRHYFTAHPDFTDVPECFKPLKGGLD